MSSIQTRWRTIAIALGAGIVASAHIGVVPAAIPALRAELGINLVMAGWVVSTFSATTVASGILVGVLADRIGYRRLLLVGLVSLVIGAFLGSIAGSETQLLLSRLIEGIGFITILVSAPSIIAEAAAPEDRRFALGLWGTYMPTGLALGMVMAPPILSAWGWHAVWQASAGLSLLWLVLVAVALRVPAHASATPGAGTWLEDVRRTLAQPGVWLLAVFFMFYAAQWMALMVWLPTVLVEERHVSVSWAALMTIAVVAVNCPGNVFGAWLLNRNVPRWMLLAGSSVVVFICAFGIFIGGVLPDAARYGLCLFFSFLTGVCPAAVLSGAAVFRPSPRQTGATNGFLIQGSNLGQLLGPPVMAALVSFRGNWGAGLWIFVATGLAGTTLALLLKREENRVSIKNS
jgi:predicted MFS family arabinose efflux permease